jgi:hypothetical protein
MFEHAEHGPLRVRRRDGKTIGGNTGDGGSELGTMPIDMLGKLLEAGMHEQNLS